MSDIIQLLPDSVANQIAAGEVIQRPASLIKELVENAIDSGGSDIKIIVKDAGRTLVQIIDNGCGMSETDARMAFERHATSKIREAKDLFAIRTMGFRGEALASIAAVAQVELNTRLHDQELGTHLVIAGSRVETQEPVACPPGSNFMVKNLFYNVPARRRFLKTNATELRRIVNEFQCLALANPEVSFTLIHNDQTLFSLPATNLRQRIMAVIGRQANQHLIPVEVKTSMVNISGWIGKPQSARKRLGDQFFFVNKRYMRHPYLHKAVTVAYENLISSEHYPPYFLFFDVDPQIVDINIHPTKTEIKFEDEPSVWKILNATIREALGKFNMVPSIDFDQADGIDIPVFGKDEAVAVPTVQINPDFNPFETGTASSPRSGGTRISSKGWETLYEGFETEPDGADEFEAPQEMIIPSRPDEEQQQGDLGFSEASQQSQMPGSLYFQIKNRYILTSVKSGLMIIDQRRAHERILFEEFMAIIQAKASLSQQSLFPEKLFFSREDALLLSEIKQDLKLFGFALKEDTDQSFVVTGLPSVLKNVNVAELVDAILESFKTGEVDAEHEAREQMAIVLARNACMKSAQALSQAEMASLINRLFLTSKPTYTPLGKKVFSIMENEELERRLR
jgi:DNA mismatch repair protein MutL